MEVTSATGEVLCLQGAVGVIVESPTDNSHRYQIQAIATRDLHELLIRLRLGDA